LPSPPEVLLRVVEAASAADPALAELTRMIAADPVFSLEILRLANAPLYAGAAGGQVMDVKRAVSVLGLRTLRNVALATVARRCLETLDLPGVSLSRLHEDSLRRAVSARLVAEALKPGDLVAAGEAFTVGLLQDLGVIVLLRRNHERAAVWGRIAEQPPELRRVVEAQLFGETHDVVGERIAAAWQLPPEIAAPMRWHHEPERAPEPHRERARIAHLAEILAGVPGASDGRAHLERARIVLGAALDVLPLEIDRMVNALAAAVEETAELLGLRVPEQPRLGDVLGRASRELANLSLAWDEELRRRAVEAATLHDDMARLSAASRVDLETGLPNREAFEDTLRVEIKRCARMGLPVVVGMIELARGEHLRREFGDAFVDHVLRDVGRSLHEALRETDTIARLDAHRFGVLLTDTDLQGGEVAGRRAQRHLSKQRLRTTRGVPLDLRLDVGLTELRGPYDGAFDVEGVADGVRLAAGRALVRAQACAGPAVALAPDAVRWTATRRGANTGEYAPAGGRRRGD
jgi:diguanylate cyclase (GGDEF)-like protein